MCRVPCYGYLIAPERRACDLDTSYIAHQCTDGGKIDAGLADGWIGSWCRWRLFCYRCHCGQSGLLGYIVGCQLHDGEVLVQCSW